MTTAECNLHQRTEANRIGEGHLNHDQRTALVGLHRAGARGFTDFELASWASRVLAPRIVAQTSIGKRRQALVEAGLVERCEERRPAPSGRTAAVWRLTERGNELAARIDIEEAA